MTMTPTWETFRLVAEGPDTHGTYECSLGDDRGTVKIEDCGPSEGESVGAVVHFNNGVRRFIPECRIHFYEFRKIESE